ncbi:hypothetical protein SAMN04488490_0276 [Marinobacter sp. LV10R510-11A]|uniref:DUF4810 domain-containing protein n=1 Tax=Marinobacter sp. LV10R510-11A TaxID=1415568 RepID=UPI000BB7DEA5|nr:DUF4810 domain-containing protein [Marinobacter sp. LV10R510-11A]SOB74748.1 hypothetical protein SAMN04488490_0276 [Marinobacter sp. LV10R510-11A]
MNKRLIPIALVVLLMTGCATGNKQLYDWGGYEQTLFVVYHEPEYKEQALNNYLTFVREHNGQSTLAPGLYAEAGTFLLEQGDVSGAVDFYKMEYERWPESRPMLGILIENLEMQQ